ncbi:MAG: hypothetical protein QXJ86_07385 [Nitrososphaerales archaeon]
MHTGYTWNRHGKIRIPVAITAQSGEDPVTVSKTLTLLTSIGSLTQLIQQAEKRNINPTQLLQKALQTLSDNKET